MTLDYATTAKALAEGGWIDQFFGEINALPVADSKETAGGRSYAEAYWDEIKYAGKLDINIAASAKADPNLIVLTTDLSGSFRSEAGTPLLTYFYQQAQGTVEGFVTIDEFPPGHALQSAFRGDLAAGHLDGRLLLAAGSGLLCRARGVWI
jgi:hypothetical protein